MSEFKSGEKVLAEAYIIGAARVQGEERYIVTDDDKYAAETLAIKKDRVHPLPTKTYEDGLREAWKMARKIICSMYCGGFSTLQIEEIFGCHDFDDVFRNYTPQEASAKIAEWEVKQEIHVGDVVEFVETGIKGLVTRSDDDGGDLYIMWEDGKHGRFYKSRESLKKTGRTIDIKALLEQIGGAEDA